MRSVNMHDAKTHFSRLVDEVAAGESITIAKAGRPVARLVPLEPVTETSARRTGFLVGRLTVPDDFDRMGSDEITAAFSGE
ncbi:MAG: type II toxin-antitoxin system Phd/YefM family antitoxin [Rhodoglobus sp.]